MATYVIGDVQGCFKELTELLEVIQFDRQKDHLWFTGDLVNRGPENLNTLRYIRELSPEVVIVLGNHDLHLLAIVFGGHPVRPTDTFADILAAEDCDQLCSWLSKFPLLHFEDGHVLVHAGIPHIWTLSQVQSLAQEVHEAIAGTTSSLFFQNMYGNEPSVWCESLTGMERLRTITNYLTRMRCISPNGSLDFQHVLAADECPVGFHAWFDIPAQFSESVLFGHWASLNGVTNRQQFQALDTGCVWGRRLTALRLSDRQRFFVEAGARL